MSKAFFKPSVAPKLLHSLRNSNKKRSIEVWLTTCIVTNFGKTRANCSVLINPSNAELAGVSNFPYFPRGGPVPADKPKSMHKDWQPLGYVSQWGGMEVGTGMLYPVSVVDGLVHQYGGWKLQAECKLKQVMAGSQKACPVGSAVLTTSGALHDEYEYIVHTTPPFYRHDENPLEYLSKCYQNAFELALSKSLRVATPLLGAGARGFPADVAIDIAAASSRKWCNDEQSANEEEQTIVFALLEEDVANNLSHALNHHD